MLTQPTIKINSRRRTPDAAVKSIQARAPWTSDRGPTDAEIIQMANWYAECQYAASIIESDSLDHGWN